ncbi:fungal-specific transcription factor domain-containing protein [Trametes maxima]|nr:fungal-specific transcription factor domain-containing protein [Trametes maxima]
MSAVHPENPKRPKLQRACDLCRRKKIRCDGMEMPDKRCSKCISYEVECTYDVVNKRPPTKSYVEILESRLQKMEELVDKLQPQEPSPPGNSGSPSSGDSPVGLSNNEPSTSRAPVALPVFSPTSPDANDLEPSDDEMEVSQKLIKSFRKFTLRDKPTPRRYHGKSSSMMLLQAAVDMKLEYTGIDTIEFPPAGEPSAVNPQDERTFALISIEEDLPVYTDFPPPDLMSDLLNAYFSTLNLYCPLLHRPTFEQGIQDGLHLRDEGFGAVVLLVLANGARWVEPPNDPRLAPYGTVPRPGWLWFQKVEQARRSLFAPPRLHDLQRYALMAEYVGGYSSPHNCWTLIGLGLRVAQDVGVHRKKTYSTMSKAEGELWKRAFWCLVAFDRVTSFTMGRSCALQDEDFDVDPVEECDDEYWFPENPEMAFKQPPGKPCKITFINSLNSLLQILAFASRTIYTINKSKALLGFVGEEWEERIVAELDSALNKWIDTVPDHLRWDPHREDIDLLSQSGVLYCKYYQLQIFVHRPFLPSARRSSRLSLPSLAICTNAARSCVHIGDVQCQRTGKPLMYNRMPIFTAGIVLLLNLWAGKRAGFTNHSAAADVQKCMSMLKSLESESRVAARLWDVLYTLYAAGDFQAPDPGEASRKRARDADESEQTTNNTHAQYTKAPAEPPTIPNVGPTTYGTPSSLSRSQTQDPLDSGTTPSAPASESHTSNAPQVRLPWPESIPSNSPASFDLPVHTEELGRVPFHHGFSPFLDSAASHSGEPAAPALAFDAPTTGPQMQGARGIMPADGFGAHSPLFDPYLDSAVSAMFAASMSYASAPALASAQFQQSSSSHGNGNGAGPGPGHAHAHDMAFPFSQPLQLPQSQPQQHQHQHIPPSPSPAGSNALARGLGTQPLTQEGLALADGTLDLWSNAPTSMDSWADWGAFINNVSGAPPPPPGEERQFCEF